MNSITEKILHLGYVDTLAAGNSVLHRLDPRAKLVCTFIFIVTVVSFNKYTISGLIPFVVFPLSLISIGGLPFRYVFRTLLLVSPLAITMAIFNPIMDTHILMRIGSLNISGGWVSFISILLRFALTVSAAFVLVSLTGFNAVCESLMSFGVPKPFVIQLQLFNRYMFVLAEEAGRMVMARAVRSFNRRPMSFKEFSSLIGHLLLRTLDRGDRIYRAMCCRGFNGHISVIGDAKFGKNEILFVTVWVILFALFRFVNLPQFLGAMFMELLK